MQTRRIVTLVIAVTALALLLAASSTVAGPPVEEGDLDAQAAPLGTAFTYQGRLTDTGSPANGSYDFQFELYDSAEDGSQVDGTIALDGVTVADGLFTVALDFGSAPFMGDARWLEIRVREGSSTGGYNTLSPRQALTATPYALHALSGPWAGLTGVPGGFADGVDNNTTYAAGTGLTLVGTTFSADTTHLQRRVTGTCAGGNAIRVINQDGTVACELDDDTTYTAGTGLTLDGTTFSANTAYLQRRVSGSCTGGNAIRVINSNGSVTCEPVDGGGVHDHWGETWSGSGRGLTLSSSDDFSLHVSGGDRGILIDSPDAQGIEIDSPGTGIYIEYPDWDGLYILGAGDHGVQVVGPDNDGVWVDSAGGDGIQIDWASGNGLLVKGPDLNGVEVRDANRDGVQVNSAGRYGVQVGSSTSYGVYVNGAGSHGIYVGNAGVNGIEIQGSAVHGVYANTKGTYGFKTPDGLYVGGKSDLVGAVDPIIGERFEVAPQGQYEVGDLLVIDPDSPYLVLSSEPNDTKVIGVVGPELDYEDGELMVIVFGWHGAKPAEDDDENVRTVARIKVDASYAAIKRGDLLTTSLTPGHAMKAQPVNVGGVEIHRPGTIIGKALESLDSGQGLIEVFIVLQ